MVRKLVLIFLSILVLSTFVSAQTYKGTLSLSGKELDGNYWIDGQSTPLEKARAIMRIGGRLPDGEGGYIQREQASGSLTLNGENRERISITFKRSDKPTKWEFSDDKIVVKQEARITHSYYEYYERNGRTRRRLVKDREETIVKYVVLPEDRKIKYFFELDGKEYKIVVDELSYTMCSSETGRYICTRY